jgi:hypothetical protein
VHQTTRQRSLAPCTTPAGPTTHRKTAKVFWFFFSKKNKKNQRLLFEKRSKNFFLLGFVAGLPACHKLLQVDIMLNNSYME